MCLEPKPNVESKPLIDWLIWDSLFIYVIKALFLRGISNEPKREKTYLLTFAPN